MAELFLWRSRSISDPERANSHRDGSRAGPVLDGELGKYHEVKHDMDSSFWGVKHRRVEQAPRKWLRNNENNRPRANTNS